MKTKLFSFTMVISLCMLSMNANAQLQVASNGNVGIRLGENVTPLSNLSIGGAGVSSAKLYVYSSGQGGSNQYGIYSSVNWGNNGTKCSIYGYCTGAGGSLIGVKGEANNSNSSIPIIGVYGIANGSTIGKNYGVYGSLKTGNYNGAGVYGTNDGTMQQLSDRYAGYFRGKTFVNGEVKSLSIYQTSDARLKTDITDIKKDAIQKVRDLHPVQFQWQQVEEIIKNDTATIKVSYFSKDVDLKQQHYGFLAQELQKLFPELVQKEGDGYLSVNYIELIPIMVQALQELSAKVEEQDKQIKKLQTSK